MKHDWEGWVWIHPNVISPIDSWYKKTDISSVVVQVSLVAIWGGIIKCVMHSTFWLKCPHNKAQVSKLFKVFGCACCRNFVMQSDGIVILLNSDFSVLETISASNVMLELFLCISILFVGSSIIRFNNCSLSIASTASFLNGFVMLN